MGLADTRVAVLLHRGERDVPKAISESKSTVEIPPHLLLTEHVIQVHGFKLQGLTK